MYHHVAHAVGGTLLFHDWTEARELWDRLTTGLPGMLALALMPNHLHALHPHDAGPDLRRLLAGFAKWRNAHRGEHGSVWDRPIPGAEWVGDADKLRRNERYVHLNPSRARLATCPLGWPFSTHRDAVGLAAFPVRRAARDRHDYHRYVSSDPSADPAGTLLPTAPHREPSAEAVLAAVSAVTRTPLSLLERRGPERTLLVRALRTLSPATIGEIVALTGVSRRQVHRVSPARDPAVVVVQTVIGDPRFPALADEDLRRRWTGRSRQEWVDRGIDSG